MVRRYGRQWKTLGELLTDVGYYAFLTVGFVVACAVATVFVCLAVQAVRETSW